MRGELGGGWLWTYASLRVERLKKTEEEDILLQESRHTFGISFTRAYRQISLLTRYSSLSH